MLITWVFGESVAFDLTGMRLDLFQFLYDLLLAACMSFVVWNITSYWEEQRRIRKSFHEDIQNLSRYLAALQKLVEAYPIRKCDLEIEQIMALSPTHESFAYLEGDCEVLWKLASEERAIRKAIGDGVVDSGSFKRYGSNLFRIRNQIVRLRLPPGRLKSHSAERLIEQIERSFSEK